MSDPYRIVVFFSRESLGQKDLFNPAARERVLYEGVEKVRARFPASRWGRPMESSMSMPGVVSGELLADVIEFVEQSKLGRVQLDGECLIAAR